MADVAFYAEGFPREALQGLLPILLRTYAAILDRPGGNVFTPLHLQHVASAQDIEQFADFVREEPGRVAVSCLCTPRDGEAGGAALHAALRPFFASATPVFRGSLGLDAAHRLAFVDGGEDPSDVGVGATPLTLSIVVHHAIQPAAAGPLDWGEIVQLYETILLCDGDA